MLIDNHIWLIGDPHFGRNFPNTPLHRRGDREKMQREQFVTELRTPDVDMVIMVGDLFDKPVVPLMVLSQVINDVVAAALLRPEVQFVYMAGNHDISRQLNQGGAWQIFDLAVSWLENVYVLNEPLWINRVAMFPWQWDVTAEDQIRALGSGAIDVVVGHWDLKDFGGDTSHLAPTKLIKELNPDAEVYSGHYHLEGDYIVDGVTVHCTGSMQPYAHGEGDMYVTLTLDEALAQADDLKDKCVRVILQPGESLPDIDCLQLSSQRGEVSADEEVEISVSTVFNLNNVLNESFDECEVPDDVRTFIMEKLGDID